MIQNFWKSDRWYFFLLRFILIFTFLKYTYLFLVAISTPGGVIPLSLAKVYNPIYLLIQLNQWVVGHLLQSINGFVVRTGNMTIGIEHGFGVWIDFPCLGIQVSYALIALLMAYPGKNKLIWIVAGLLGIQCINFIRIYGIIVVGHYYHYPKLIDTAHLIYNLIVYCALLFYFYRYTKLKKYR